jgi:hypothetical protein
MSELGEPHHGLAEKAQALMQRVVGLKAKTL